MKQYCTAPNCSHSGSHNILSHSCSKCSKYGHESSFECQVVELPPSIHCQVVGCSHPQTHMIDGHQCRMCCRYGHGFMMCQFSDYEKVLELYPDVTGEIYTTRYTGMGSYLYQKRSHCGKVSAFSMDHGDWGQYGHSKVPKLLEFLEGAKPLRDCDYIMF